MLVSANLVEVEYEVDKLRTLKPAKGAQVGVATQLPPLKAADKHSQLHWQLVRGNSVRTSVEA